MSSNPQPSEELSSWKEIAAHLGVSVRTAQMWEKDRGLPVRRLPGGNRVLAFTHELQDWKLSSSPATDPEPLPEVVDAGLGTRSSRAHGVSTKKIFIGVLIVGVMILAAWMWRDRPVPGSFRIHGRQIEIFDQENRKLWSLDYHDELIGEVKTGVKQTLVSIHDLNADGIPEIVVFPSLVARDGRVNQDILCYSAKGSLLWKYRVEKPVKTSDSEFFPPFEIRSFVVLPPDPTGHRRIAVTASHYRLFPSQIAILDHAGKLLREYWHGGHINVLKVSGRNLLAAGVSNQTNEATLLVFNPDTLAGASMDDAAHQIVGKGPGTEIARFLFPRSCINQKYSSMGFVSLLDVTEHEITVHTIENDLATRMWNFDPSLSFRQLVESSMYTKLKSDKPLSPACLAAEAHVPRRAGAPNK